MGSGVVVSPAPFGPVWTNWVLSLLHGSQTCINFDGSPSPYFFCKRGLRQGDPLSPFLFDLVTDALSQSLNRDKHLGLVHGLGPSLADGHNIINFHYADDTIFFLQADFENVETALWAMVAFEALSGITINFQKIELIPVNISSEN